MSEAATVDVVRFAWLTLVTMMLLSRVLFQLRGAARMRAFLDVWKASRTKRVWGAASLAFAGAVAVSALTTFADPSASDVAVTAALVAVMVADGAVNVLPAGFETFKDRVQRRWVGRTERHGLADDRYLFAVGNALLAAAAAGAGLVVVLYRPLAVELPIGAVAAGAVLTGLLVQAAARERRAQP